MHKSLVSNADVAYVVEIENKINLSQLASGCSVFRCIVRENVYTILISDTHRMSLF